MVTSKTTKALSFLLPVALLVSVNINALDGDTNTTVNTALKGAFAAVKAVFGLGLLRNGYAVLANEKNADSDKTEKVKVKVAFSLDKDKKNIVDQFGNVVAAVTKDLTKEEDAKKATEALNKLSKDKFADELKDYVAAGDLAKDAVKNAFGTVGTEVEKEQKAKNGWSGALKNKLSLNQNPFKAESNVVTTYAPIAGGVSLLVSAGQDVADLAGFGSETSEE